MKLIGRNYVPLGDNLRKSPIKPGPYPDAQRSRIIVSRSPIKQGPYPDASRSPIDRSRAPLGKIFGK
jgi:hypothetical protein